MQVKLYTDYSVVRYGFDIVRIEAKKGPDILARFPGQWYEPHTEVRDTNTNTLQHAGLHYNWHRYYDPNIGRYITPDPIGLAGGLNVYAYADNDPVNHIDPDGLDVIYWYWSFWNNRTSRWIPHAGIQITPSLRKYRTPQIHAERSTARPIYFDWYPEGMGTEFNKGVGHYYRFETSSKEDICIIKSAVSKMVHCKSSKHKNSSSCEYNPATNNCFQWVSQTLAGCGVYLDFARNNYNPRHIRLRPVRRPITVGSYDWTKPASLGKVTRLDPLVTPKLFSKEIRRMYGSQAANSIYRIIQKKSK